MREAREELEGQEEEEEEERNQVGNCIFLEEKSKEALGWTVVDLQTGEKEGKEIRRDMEMEIIDTDISSCIPFWRTLLLAFLPPSLTTTTLTPRQRSNQIFPYNMSATHSLSVYLLTLSLSLLLFYHQHLLFNQLYPIRPHSVAEDLFYATAVLNELFYIYFVAYPIVYAVLLRVESEEGRWPSSVRVWGSERMVWEEREVERREDEEGCGKSALLEGWRRLAGYTFYGDLGRRCRLDDVEDGMGSLGLE